MTNWIDGPLAAFDLEATGVDVETARIVTACVVQMDEDRANPRKSTWLVNPGIPIPAGATEVHGITDEMAQANGMAPWEAVQDIVHELAKARWGDYPVIAYNASYDLTLLDREVRRCDGDEGLGTVPYVVDPLVIDKAVDKYRKGKRTLAATCEHYGVKLEGAHSADGDALAAARVAWAICKKYPEIAEMSLPELHDAQVGWAAEQSESFRQYLYKKAADSTDPGEHRELFDRADAIDTRWPIHPEDTP